VFRVKKASGKVAEMLLQRGEKRQGTGLLHGPRSASEEGTMNWEYTGKKASDMNGGGSRALLGQSKKKKAKSKLAAEASARKRKEEKERN
jgi:hypothetical protein